MTEVLDHQPGGRVDSLYRHDFYTWCMRQAELIQAGRFSEIDVENVVEELQSLGKEQVRGLRSSYRLLLLHLLKWGCQPRRRSRSWRTTIVRERDAAAERLDDNRGLKQARQRLFTEAYRSARKEAAAETGLPLTTFPLECPFTMDQALDEDFWPEPDAGAR